MPRLTDQDLKAIQDVLAWMMTGILLPIGLSGLGDDWLTGLSYIVIAVILCPLTVGARWLKITISFIIFFIVQL
ncbi:MAG: hypothetical protein KME10_03910 [Plectolyngbya sp. WJT66-NPBG17]|jgi:hypothetical protein|nr:hypothetical protein [Plectolyngbya sp. WJT66-NPBG17]MBW4528084.1 hypothetical protein [Phormidium tanganyikae FI6-MK23]